MSGRYVTVPARRFNVRAGVRSVVLWIVCHTMDGITAGGLSQQVDAGHDVRIDRCYDFSYVGLIEPRAIKTVRLNHSK